MAIDKRLLDDIAPSTSAVSRLKNRPRRIKPWESDILLRSPDEQSTSGTVSPPPSGGTTSPVSDSTNMVPHTESVLPTNDVPAPNSVLSTISEVRPSSLSTTKSKLASSLVPNTKSAESTASVLSTETAQPQNGANYCDQDVTEVASDCIPTRKTKSVPSTGSVLSAGSSPNTALAADSGIAPTTELEADTELEHQAGDRELLVHQRRGHHCTEPGVNTNVDVRYHSVASTDAEPSYQTGTIQKSKRSISTSSTSAKRAQPYVISEAENFTRVPHAVTEALQREEFSSRQFRILVTILRETLGWGREYAELSAKDFAKKTGIAASHIFITLRDLEDEGAIIRRVNGKNAKNSYALNRGFFAKYSTKRGSEGGPPTSTDPVPGTEDVLGTDLVSELSPDPVSRTHHQFGAITSILSNQHHNTILIGKKVSKKLKNSLHEIPEILRGLIESTRPAAKLESEKECAFELLAEYSAEDLAIAVNHLQQNGVLGTGEPCHSPFRYLMSAAEQVLAQVSRVQKKQAQVSPNVIMQSNDTAEPYEEAIPLFENRLSDDAKQQYIAKYIEVELPHGFLPPQGVLRKLAALRWYTEQRSVCAGTAKLAEAQ